MSGARIRAIEREHLAEEGAHYAMVKVAETARNLSDNYACNGDHDSEILSKAFGAFATELIRNLPKVS